MRILTFIIFFSFTNFANASIITQIINNFESTKNMKFNFVQTINGKVEEGKCTLVYPKKIFCEYISFYNKILVSNGKSLVINSDKNNQYYRYPLKNTPLLYLLDKEFILRKIKNLELLSLKDKFFYFSIDHEGQIINLFFDKKSFDLLGWQTEDIFQNLTVTRIYNIKKNSVVDENIFILPSIN